MARRDSQGRERRDGPDREQWEGTSLHATYQGSDSAGADRSARREEQSRVTIADVVFSLLGEPFEE